MDLRVVIPVKPFTEAKQRLASVLNRTQRAELAERMFRQVFGVAASWAGAANVVVVSRAEDILAMVRNEGGIVVQEEKTSSLNSALSHAAVAAAVSRILVVAGDLPFLAHDDLAEMARGECAIAPDRHRRGTNALLWPAQLPFAFGENSFARHRAIAEGAGLIPTVVLRRGLAHDVDVPDDLNSVEI
ncbi:MAG TPA: 2-phospho-L-lactate guanylyltransferase [Rhizomicrobium sp.]|nr:2-phospho-L-lactate guanylyltransferase [Rhizomicrobium sp.]